jgi:hypothetical protein
MPARNSIEKVISDLNERAKPFNLTVLKVEHYQNVRKSKISLMDQNNNTLAKSLEKWREYFAKLEQTENKNLPISLSQPENFTLEEKVRKKAESLNHTITNFVFPNYRNAQCTVHCNLHNQTYENVKAAYYVLSKNKYGIKCCAAASRKRKK